VSSLFNPLNDKRRFRSYDTITPLLKNQTYSNKGWKNVLLIVVPYLVVGGAFQFIALRVAGLEFSSEVLTTDKHFFIIALFDLLVAFLLVAVFTVYFVKDSFISVGFRPGFILTDIFVGISTGFVIMFISLLILVQTGQVEVKNVDRNVVDGLWIFGTFVFVGISEELLLRGYVLNNLMVSFNKYTALVISSALFAFMHIANPNLDMLGFAGLFFAGLFLGYAYIITQNLWLPIALHFSWNFFQSFFGFNVSGNDFYSFVITTFQKENIWNGGDFGFEGSLISLIFQPLMIVSLYFIFRKRNIEMRMSDRLK